MVKTAFLVVTGIGLLVEGCGGSSSASSAADSGSGGRGTAGAASAPTAGQGGDSAQEIPARASVSFSVEPVDPAVVGESCSVVTAASIGATPPTTTMVGDSVTDGVDGVQVTCRVSEAAGGYELAGSVRSGTTALTMTATTDPSGTGSGQVSVATEFAILTSDSATPCTFEGLQIKPGAYWAGFSCPLAADATSPASTTCALSGVIAFQDCQQ